MFRKFFSKAALAFLFMGTGLMTASAQKLDLSQQLPIGKAVTKGKLANGLTYYIRPNSKPANKVELRLVVDAGSILENEDQQGLAHFMEHMEFNGLKHFPKNDLVHYLQSIGVRFGADLNANTMWDRTYYILPIPTDKPGNLDKGFQILADWAGGALISTNEVNDERHVISEELRMRDKNAGTRMMKQFLPDLLNHSRYAYRLPGGKDSIVLHANPKLIREFYHDWYRPDLMAVIVVGDITPAKGEELIKKYFGGLKNPAVERTREYYYVEPYKYPNALIVTDKEATDYSFDLTFSAKQRKITKTLGDYRNDLIKNIFEQTLNRKLQDMTQSAKPPFVSANASVDGLLASFTLKNIGFTMSVTPVSSFKESIDSAIAEILRVKDYGFTNQDIEITKNSILASYEQAYNERDKTVSSDLVDEYTRNFMRQEPIPGITNEYDYVKEMLPGITAKEVSDEAAKVLSDSKNFFALITAPDSGNITLPTRDQLINTVTEAFQQKVSRPVEGAAATSLLTKQPKAGRIVATATDAALGTTTYTLSNGIKVTVKPTNFKDDEIVFTGVKYGGSGQFGVKDKANAQFLTDVIETMGYGQFTPTALNNFLAGKNADVSMAMGNASNAVNGSSSVRDFKTLLELNYLKLTEPRMDQNLYEGFLTKMETQLKFIKANPQVSFIDTLVKTMYGNSPLAPISVPTEAILHQIDPNRCIEIYKQQFGDASGFHFFLVGNVDKIKDLKSLIEEYIGGLPVEDTKPMYKDNGLRPVSGIKEFKYYKGSDQKSLLLQFFHGDKIKYSDKLAMKADLLGQIMTMEILDTIREKLAYIYSGGANAKLIQVPYPHYVISAQMPCGPDNVDKILAELKKEYAGIKQNGGPKGYLEKAKTQTLEGRKEDIKKNSFWANQLQQIMVWGDSQDFFLNYDKELNSITPKDIAETAKELLGDNEFTAVSFPELTPAAKPAADKK